MSDVTKKAAYEAARRKSSQGLQTQVQLDQPQKPSQVDVTRSFGGFGQTLLEGGANLLFGSLGSAIGGSISDYYNRKSEERMDMRNRQLILDTPSLTTEGRRRAGLNPYGDPILPGMSSQSTTDTSDVSPDSFYKAQQMTLQERIAMKQLENETNVANSQANRNNAEADRLRGQEGRDVNTFDLNKKLLEANVTTAEENAIILGIEREIKDATKSNEIKYSQERLNKVIADIKYVEEMTDKSKTAQLVDKSLVLYYLQMRRTLKAEAALMCAQKSFVEQNKDLTYWKTEFAKEEFAWYNGDKSVNGVQQPGLWQLAVSLQSSNIEQLQSVADYYDMFVKNLPSWKQQEFEIMAKNAAAAYMQAMAADKSADAQQKMAAAQQQQADNQSIPIMMKILGGLLMIGGALAAPVTGGASIPLIGVGAGMYLEPGLGTSN